MSRKLYQKPDLKGRRQARMACVLRRSISSILLKRFPSLSITVSKVVLSADFHHAKVFVVSVDSNSSIVPILEDSSYDLGKELSGKVRLPVLPRLKFSWDSTFDSASRMNSIFNSDE